jgi:aryl-alcohol dehydrogenase-like predicted oxidoreductase
MHQFCKETGVGMIPWSPLFSRQLARLLGYDGSIRSARSTAHDDGMTEADEEIVRRVEEFAGKKGWKMSQVALVSLKMKRGGVDCGV